VSILIYSSQASVHTRYIIVVQDKFIIIINNLYLTVKNDVIFINIMKMYYPLQVMFLITITVLIIKLCVLPFVHIL